MRNSIRYVVGACAVSAMLAGCSGSQPPISASSEAPQASAATGYKSLYSFGKRFSGGLEPKAALINVSGTLYGTTFAGGRTGCVGGCGVVFTITPSGKEKTLYRFRGGSDGANPGASLVAVNGLLYGTTEYGGYPSSGGCNAGTVFSISASGIEKVVYPFYGYYCHDYVYNDGANPVASLIDVKGRLYGTTSSGGTAEYYGTVFRLTTNGREKVLHSFSLFNDGAMPLANLVDVSGTLYGTTEIGEGTSSGGGYGTVFSISVAGAEQVLYNFPYGGPDGELPLAALIKINGALYGTTAYGGTDGDGTIFSITTSGSLTDLYSFGASTDGRYPYAPLLNIKRALYGTTELGGTYGKWTIFKMTLSGKEKVLHSFGYGSDGAMPLAGLIDVNGTLYGATSAGGVYGNGTIFALTL